MVEAIVPVHWVGMQERLFHLESSHSNGKDAKVQHVCQDTVVQFHWYMIVVSTWVKKTVQSY